MEYTVISAEMTDDKIDCVLQRLKHKFTSLEFTKFLLLYFPEEKAFLIDDMDDLEMWINNYYLHHLVRKGKIKCMYKRRKTSIVDRRWTKDLTYCEFMIQM